MEIKLTEGQNTDVRDSDNEVLEEVVILDAAQYSNVDTACVFDNQMRARPMRVNHLESRNALSLYADSGDILTFDEIRSIQFGDSTTDKMLCNLNFVVAGEHNGVVRDGLRVT